MPDPFNPEAMTPEERAGEVATLLATGYLRHRALRATGAAPPLLPVRSALPDGSRRQPENDLETPGDQSVHAFTAEPSTPWPERS